MRCAICGKRAVHLHHILPRQVLRRERRRDCLTDSRGLMPLCFDCHFNHESWAKRITREQIPESAWEFARELGAWAVCRMEQDHPVRGDSAGPTGGVRA